LAFDTIYAEGQRRYVDFSAYARQFLGGLERPDVDKIDGLSPVIAIEQKNNFKSPLYCGHGDLRRFFAFALCSWC
jgi:excinuclease ABC subunit A